MLLYNYRVLYYVGPTMGIRKAIMMALSICLISQFHCLKSTRSILFVRRALEYVDESDLITDPMAISGV
jgi:hypothetical protein